MNELASTHAVAPRSWRRIHWPRIYGYDFFVSFKLGPAPIGAQSYCSDLARRLREQDFTVFFSEEEAAPGAQLDTTLLKALRHSRILVVVLNEGAILQSTWVRREVEEFRRVHPGRLVIPIDVGGSIGRFDQRGEVAAWLGHRGRIWLNERDEAVAEGIASAEVVERLQVSHRFLRVNTLLRWTLVAIGLALSGLTLWASFEAWDAKRKFREGTALRLAAEGVAMASGEKAGGAVRGLLQVLAAHRISRSADTDTALQTASLKFQHQAFIREVDSAIASLAFSPDGIVVVSGSYDGTLQSWDVASGSRVGTAWSSPHRPVSSLAYTADAGRIISGDSQGNLNVWSASSHLPVVLHGAVPRPWFNWSVAASLDGGHFAWGREMGEVEVWDLAAGRSLSKFTPKGPPAGAPLSLTFSPDNRVVAFYTSQGKIVAFHSSASAPAAHTEVVHRVRTCTACAGVGQPLVRSGVLAFSPDGAWLVSGSSDGRLQRWDVVQGRALSSPIDGHDGGVTGIAYSGDGQRIVSVGNDGALRTWDATTLRTEARFESAHTGPITALALNARTGRFASAGLDNTLRLWSRFVEPMPDQNPNLAPVDDARAVAFDRQGHAVVSGARVRTTLTSPAVIARSLRGTHFVVHNVDATLTLWDARTNRAIGTLAGVPGDDDTAVRDAMFSADGAFLFSLDRQDRIVRWDAESGKALPPLATDGLNTAGIAMSRDGRTMTTGSRDGVIRTWDVATGEGVSRPIRLSAGSVDALAFSPDGRRVVTASPDGALHLWDAATGAAVLGPLLGHFTSVGAVAFSPDGLRIVSAGGVSVRRENEQPRLDYTLRLWDATSGRAIGRPLGGQVSDVVDVAFSGDGKRIASTSRDGRLQVLDVFEGWGDVLCAKLPRNPTAEEWRDWVSPDMAYVVPCPHLEQRRLH